MRLLPINKFHIMDRLISLIAGLALAAAVPFRGEACTGIALTAKDGSRVVARTTEWGGSVLNSSYVVVPRGHQHVSFTPSGQDGMQFAAKYGYVGICTDRPEFVVEGMNEAGLSAGLFFFPNYGEYVAYNPDNKANTLSDMQFVSWVLANFSEIAPRLLKYADAFANAVFLKSINTRSIPPSSLVSSTQNMPFSNSTLSIILASSSPLSWYARIACLISSHRIC